MFGNTVGFLISFSRGTLVPMQLKRSEVNSVPLPVLITLSKAPVNVASTSCTTIAATVSQFTVIWSPSLVWPGPWLSPGVLNVAGFPNLWRFPSSTTLPWTKMPRTGTCTARAWHEWGLYRITPATGELHAATRLMESISQTTSVAPSRISTSWIILGEENARK